MAEAFDNVAGHKHFSGACFNKAWDYLDKAHRSEEETEAMIHTAHASFYHWRERSDRTDKNLSMGYWLLSRVYVVAGHADEAMRYAERALAVAKRSSLEPFYEGYAYEAKARAAKLRGFAEEKDAALDQARACCEFIEDKDSQLMLEADLDQI